MIVLVVSCIGFEISSLSVPRWFSQGSGYGYWEGGLLTPYPSSTLYKDKACDRDFHGSGYCDMFNNLWKGGIVYIFFESVSLFLFFVALVFFVVDIVKNKNLAFVNMIVVWSAVTAHFIGFVTWAVLGKLLYQGTCDSYYTDNGDSPANICRKEGASLALFIILYIPIVGMLQTVLWHSVKDKKKKDRVKKTEYKPAPGETPSEEFPEPSSREFVSRDESSADHPSISVEISR